MLGQLLKLGMVFDWIRPVAALVQNLVNGPSHVFAIPEQAGWSGADIERLLARYGISIWGRMVINGCLVFSVRQAQARWAEYVLQRAGLPIVSGRTGKEAKRSRRPPGNLKKLESWLDDVVRKTGSG
jgi:hypothetical protein